jgi:hypothetical protein
MAIRTRTIAALAGLTAALTLPIAAGAAVSTDVSRPAHYALQTREVTDMHAGEYDGVLAMTVFPDGTVQGTYREVDTGNFREVTGGVTGDQIWLDIGGAMRDTRLTGTFRNGVLDTVVNGAGANVTHFVSTGVADQR